MRRLLLALLFLLTSSYAEAAYQTFPASNEDVAHSGGESLIRSGCKRTDSAASSAGSDGDWATINCDDTGRLRVNAYITGTDIGSQLAEFDYDTGGGTVTQSTIGLALAGNGGPVAVSSSNPLPVIGTGSAGTAATGVVTVQGISSMTPLIVTATNLDVQIGGSDSLTIGTFPDNEPFNVAQINGVTPLMGAGNTGTGSLRVTEATDSQLSAGVGATGDSAATAGSTGSVTAKLRLVTSQLDTISTNLSSLLTSSQLIDDDQVGASMHHRISAGSTEDEHEVKGSAGRLFSINVTNTNAAARYLRCANQVAASTTPGTTTAWYGMAIPGSTTGAGYTANFGPTGAAFSTGLTCWLVTGAAENDVAEVAANEINVNYVYK